MNQSSIEVQLEGGSKKAFQRGVTVLDALKELEVDTTKVIGISLDGELLDLQSPISKSGAAKPIALSDDTPEARAFYRHSFSHILAQAVKRLFPDAKLAIGPATAEGFYYDFEVTKPFTPEDLEAISKEMKKVIEENHKFVRSSLSAEEAKQLLQEQNEPYKLELLEEFKSRGDEISVYRDGDFIDLCRGPHIPSTKQVRFFKLLDVAGAYWRGDEKRKMLQRIYGTAFLKKEDLDKHIWQIEEAKKRDHRKLGKELDLFSINPEEVGSGLILWHPKGGLIRYLVEEHCKKQHIEAGYDFVYTPHVGRGTLWQTSGHLDFYKDGMFAPIEVEGQEYYLKPMNCPFHCHIYKAQLRSYRDLPRRFAEWGTVYRYERSGTLQGLTRVRGFTQDDAHLFCRADQMPEEIDKVLSFSINLLRDFGLVDFHLYLSTRPEQSVGSEENWSAAQDALRAALGRSGLPYSINEGDGAFYGPKIDICLKDAIGREWQLSTIQFDFNLPERFDLKYTNSDGKESRPYMIHRALLGSMERFFALLIEHYGGNFPVWLAPVQVTVLPISEAHKEYAEGVARELTLAGLRTEVDSASNTLNYRIRTAQKQKIPFMIVVGDREAQSKEIAVRLRSGDQLDAKTVQSFLNFAKEKIETRAAI